MMIWGNSDRLGYCRVHGERDCVPCDLSFAKELLITAVVAALAGWLLF